MMQPELTEREFIVKGHVPKSFLEFVARRLLGPPISGSCWRCPYCDSSGPSFSVRPPKLNPATGEPYPIKFRCFRCPAWGDEFDLIELAYPDLAGPGKFPARRDIVTRLRAEYDAGLAVEWHSPMSSLRGPGSAESIRQNAYDRDPREDEFCDEADAAIAELLALLPDGATLMPSQPSGQALVLCRKALEICAQHGLHPAGFAGRVGYVIWVHEMLRDHAANCDDPDCGRECVELRARLRACNDPDCQNALQCLFEDRCQAALKRGNV